MSLAPSAREEGARWAPDEGGLLILDKARGLSNARALLPLKRILKRGLRVGHAGTLDPFATGLLAVLVGEATRLQSLVMDLPKVYLADLLFGVGTPTLDPESPPHAEADPGPWRPRALEEAVRQQVGRVEQIPPAYSALKVGGRRAYDLARKGQEPELRPRLVRIDGIQIVAVRWPRVRIRVRCGAGTYLRALARDLGQSLGLPAMLEALRRESIGPFEVGQAVPEEGWANPAILEAHRVSPLRIVRAAALPELRVDQPTALRLVQGQRIDLRELPTLAEGVRVAVLAGEAPGEAFVGLAEPADGALRPRLILPSARRALTPRIKE